ncbi:MAG: hypothetical protein ACREGF_02880, partial [Candidatus Saccharimonadales bacterium]
VIAGGGYYVYHKQHEAKTVANVSGTADRQPNSKQTTSSAKSAVASEPKVVYDNKGLVLYSVASEATTADQHGLATVNNASCIERVSGAYPALDASKAVAVTSLKNIFSNADFFVPAGDFVRLDDSCLAPGQPLEDPLEDGNIYGKLDGGGWSIISSDLNGISCASVDGIGIPSTLVSSCYYGSDSSGTITRAPTP